MGREPIIIDGKEGYMNRDGAWIPKKQLEKAQKKLRNK